MQKMYVVAGVVLMMAACGGSEKDYDATGTFEATETTVFAEQSGALLSFDVNEGDMIEAARQVGLIDTTQTWLKIQQNENIARYQKLMAQHGEIISLRQAVRKAAESKLAHGIIDVNDLVREINQENAACVQQSVHEIEMLKEIYDNKYTTNQ